MFRSLVGRSAHLARPCRLDSRTLAPALGAPCLARRNLNLHEFQSKSLVQNFGARIQRGAVAHSPEEALKVAQGLKADGAKELVIKAQILAGGRGKGAFTSGFQSGVHVVEDAEQVEALAKQMIGGSLVTKQTGPEGQPCQSVLVHESLDFDRELYFAIVLDRETGGPVMVASPVGGVDIEEVAESQPDKVRSVPFDFVEGLNRDQALDMSGFLGLEGEQREDGADQIEALWRLMRANDATQVEINPMVVGGDGKVYLVDAKLNFDDNAAFRNTELHAQRDFSMEDPREVEAHKHELNYIGLDGNIGCMVNGAGLAMATMDIIKLNGAAPANFLDVGGNANVDQVTAAFEILQSDSRVKAILVNIFGGIMRCDIIAEGIVEAVKRTGLKLPLVVRLEGTNKEKGEAILAASGFQITAAHNLDDAAQKAVKAVA